MPNGALIRFKQQGIHPSSNENFYHTSMAEVWFFGFKKEIRDPAPCQPETGNGETLM